MPTWFRFRGDGRYTSGHSDAARDCLLVPVEAGGAVALDGRPVAGVGQLALVVAATATLVTHVADDVRGRRACLAVHCTDTCTNVMHDFTETDVCRSN